MKHYLYGFDKSYSFVDYDYDVTTILPTSGGAIGGNDITISGYGFGNSEVPSVTVTICGRECQIVSYDGNSDIQDIKCTIPIPSVQIIDTKLCEIVVSCNGCLNDDNITYHEKYEYNESLTPSIVGFHPNQGSSAGGYNVTFFTRHVTDSEVLINNINCTSTIVGNNSVTCVVGSHETLTPFLRTDSLMYQKFGNMVIFQS
mgnify:CR=1 FL=1